MRLKQTSETVCTDGRVPNKIRERINQTVGSATESKHVNAIIVHIKGVMRGIKCRQIVDESRQNSSSLVQRVNTISTCIYCE